MTHDVATACTKRCEDLQELSRLRFLMLDNMIDEVQRELTHTRSREDVLYMLAKRDALNELKMRARNGKTNHRWAQNRPTFPEHQKSEPKSDEDFLTEIG